MPFRRIVGSARFNRLVESILLQVPGKARPNVSTEFIIWQMQKTGLLKKCSEIARQARLEENKIANEVAEAIQKELLRRKSYEK